MRAPNGAADLVQFRPQPLRDCRGFALCARDGKQIYLDVRLVGLPAQEVMPHQPVEVVRPRGAGVDLVVHDFRLLAEITSQGLRDVRGLFQRRSVGHVDDDLELALVVEGQHLYAHPLQRNERDRPQGAARPRCPETASAVEALQNQRIHEAAIEAAWSSPPLRAGSWPPPDA